MRLENQVALVTAAAGAGIGQAVARKFLDEGAQLVISDAHERRAKQLADELSQQYGREVLGQRVDVTDRAQVSQWVQTAVDRHGQIDILFNNAGINRLQPVWEMEPENWDFVIGVNLTGTFNVTRAVLPHMVARKSGKIISMASVAGWLNSDEGEAHYCAAKAGIMGFTRAASAELGKHRIRINAIAPGLIYNEFLARIYPPNFFPAIERKTPVGRLGQPADIANLALFLASDESSYITGEIVCISGGLYTAP
jgi:3-oxoacyl-[acyl-carrier protein] reductase